MNWWPWRKKSEPNYHSPWVNSMLRAMQAAANERARKERSELQSRGKEARSSKPVAIAERGKE